MKKTISFCLIVLLTVGLFSCSEPKEAETESAALGTTENVAYPYEIPDPALLRSQDRGECFIETEDYYYYLYQNKVYFSTKDDPTFYLLCGKPDCSHGGTDCNAYAGWALGWWDGKLYGVAVVAASGAYLVSMDMDGSNHIYVAAIEEPLGTDGSYGGGYTFFFHDGFLYYYILATPNAFFRVDLSTGETSRFMEEELNAGGAIFERWLYDGDDMYFILYDAAQEQYLYRLSGTDGERVRKWNFGTSRWDIKGDMIYFYSAEYQAFCEYDLSTGTLTKKQDFTATYGAAYYDTDYIYLVTWDDYDGGRVVYFFDWNYQLLGEIELTSAQDLRYAAGDKVFFSGAADYPLTYYVPKTAIGTGELELIEVTNPYSYR